jgi:hypothetical protein
MAFTPDGQDREASEPARPVVCPVCRGGKLSITKTSPCMCCNGAGEITSEKSEVLSRVRADLAARLQRQDATRSGPKHASHPTRPAGQGGGVVSQSISLGKVPDSCRVCGRADFSWATHYETNSGVQQGRLRTSEVKCSLVLGCDYCSETLKVVSADKLADALNMQGKESSDG